MVAREIWRGEIMELILNEYRHNSKFRKYVNEYCKKNKCTIKDALKTEKVKQRFWLYTEL